MALPRPVVYGPILPPKPKRATMPVNITDACEKCGNRAKQNDCRYCLPCLMAPGVSLKIEEAGFVLEVLKAQSDARINAIRVLREAKAAYQGCKTDFANFLAWLSGLCESLAEEVTGKAKTVFALTRRDVCGNQPWEVLAVFGTKEEAEKAKAECGFPSDITEYQIKRDGPK